MDSTHAQKATASAGTPLPTAGYYTKSPFVVDQDTYIVAAVGGNYASAHPKLDGWFVSDFYAFNFLFKGLGRKQAWITGAVSHLSSDICSLTLILIHQDPHTLVHEYGNYLHGNPNVSRKIVLSNELLNSGELSPVEVVDPASVGKHFIDKVRDFGKLAREENAKLLLLIFCHGTDTGELELKVSGQDGRSRKITLAQVRKCIESGVNTTLITSACYSGKWLVDPIFNYTAIAAATDETESLSWALTRSMGRACKSIFASALIKSLSESSADCKSENSELATETKTFIEFCRGVDDTISPHIQDSHEFMFAAQDDAWDMAWPDRTGISYLYFKQRWQTLETYVPVPAPADAEDGGQHQASLTIPSSRVGSSATRSSPASELDDAEKATLRGLISSFLATNPGSWRFSAQQSLGAFLRDCHERGSPWRQYHEESIQSGQVPPLDQQFNAYSIIQYRIEFARAVDFVVRAMGLPRPFQQDALQHDHFKWIAATVDLDTKDGQHEWGSICSLARSRFIDSRFIGGRLPSQGPQFHVMGEYMTAVMHGFYKSTGCDETATSSKVDEFFERFDAMKKSLLDFVAENKTTIIARKHRVELEKTLAEQ